MKKKDFYTDIEKVGDPQQVSLVKIHGFLDESTTPEMEKQLNALIGKGRLLFVFDCADMTYIASSGMGLFIKLYGTVSEKDGDFVFIHVRPEIQRIFSMLGLSKLFKFRDTLDAALKEFP